MCKWCQSSYIPNLVDFHAGLCILHAKCTLFLGSTVAVCAFLFKNTMSCVHLKRIMMSYYLTSHLCTVDVRSCEANTTATDLYSTYLHYDQEYNAIIIIVIIWHDIIIISIMNFNTSNIGLTIIT